jgi:cytochrome b
VSTGLVADDEIATTGPLNRYVGGSTATAATAWHKDVGQWLLIALVVLHVGAILYYRLRLRRDLIGPMWTGDKALPPGTPAAVDSAGSRLLALVIGAASAGVVAWVVSLGG